MLIVSTRMPQQNIRLVKRFITRVSPLRASLIRAIGSTEGQFLLPHKVKVHNGLLFKIKLS